MGGHTFSSENTVLVCVNSGSESGYSCVMPVLCVRIHLYSLAFIGHPCTFTDAVCHQVLEHSKHGVFMELFTDTSSYLEVCNMWTGMSEQCRFRLECLIRVCFVSHLVSTLWRQFARSVKSCFLGKVRKIYQYVVCRSFYPEC